MRGGRPLSRGHIYHLLSRPLYIGRIAHNKESFEGQHLAIIDPETWDAVQKQLAEQAPARPARRRAPRSSPLRGKLFDEIGAALTPTHAVKSGRRYRYYASRTPAPGPNASRAANATPARWRLPAREIERAVGDSLLRLFANPAELVHVARESDLPEARVSELLEGMLHWEGKPLEVVERIDLASDEMTLHLDLTRILGKEGTVVRYAVPTRIRRRGVEMRLVLDGDGGTNSARVDPALVKAVVRARRWFKQIESGEAKSFNEIAKAENVTDRYVGRLMPLAFLAPDIVAQILVGTQPVDLTAEALIKRTDLPATWAEQRERLGIK